MEELKTATGPMVFKRYHDGMLCSPHALEILVKWRCQLDASSQQRVDETSAWPLRLVGNGKGTAGVLMRRAPDIFFQPLNTGLTKPRSLSYLVHAERAEHLGVTRPSLSQRIDICRLLVEEFAFWHAARLVRGDVSLRNDLWSLQPTSVFAIDCDSMRFVSESGALREVRTPDFHDPHTNTISLVSDRYKPRC